MEKRTSQESGSTGNNRAYADYKERYRNERQAEDYYQTSGPRSARWFLHRRNLVGWLVATLETRAARRLLSRCQGSSVLDVPCGSGKLLPTLTGMYPSVIGVDASAQMLSKIDKTGLNGLTLIESDIRSMPLSDDSVDVVVCNRFLHRMPPEAHPESLRELHRVSRRYAVFYFNIKGLLTNAVLLLERILHLGNRGRLYHMSKEAISQELRGCGWEILRFRPVLPLGLSMGYLVLAEKKAGRR